jgi:DNA (cytosine-5)-methyltransferase 1
MRYVELFCGAGGTSCGLVGAGWECAGAADLDATALATYAANFPVASVWSLSRVAANVYLEVVLHRKRLIA